MLFNSLPFLFFLPATLLLFYSVPRWAQNHVLLGASWFFYGWWSWELLGLLVATTVVDYWVGRGLGAVRGARGRRLLLIASLTASLGLLALFKYAGFFVEALILAGRTLGLDLDVPLVHLALPVGISFYTFQTMNYVIDVYPSVRTPSACRSTATSPATPTSPSGYDLAATPGESRIINLHYDRRLPRRNPRLSGLLDRIPLFATRGDDPLRAWVGLFDQLQEGADPLPGAVAARGWASLPAQKEDLGDDPARWARHALIASHLPPAENEAVVVAATKRVQARGVRVIFVSPPLSPRYAGPGPMMRDHRACVARLLAATGADYFDLTDLVPIGRGWFRNADHVQGEGTRIFSARVRELVERR